MQWGQGALDPSSFKEGALPPHFPVVSSMPTETLPYEIHDGIARNAKMPKNEGTVY